MNQLIDDMDAATEFRIRSTFSLAITALCLLALFAINSFLQDRTVLGAGLLCLVVVAAFNAWDIKRHRRISTGSTIALVATIIAFLMIAFRGQGIAGVLLCYPAILAFYCILPERKAWFANAALLLVIVPQAWVLLDMPLALRVAASLATVSLFSALFVRVITGQQIKLETRVVTDSVTGLLNRAQLSHTLKQAVELYQRNKTPMTLLTLELDDFQSITDTQGPDDAERVLQRIGNLLRQHGRRADTAFRLERQEFLVLLYGANAANGLRIAEDLRKAIETAELLPDCAVTVSIGLATLQPHEHWSDWTKRCDRNLYCAKAGGHNRVMG